MTAPLSTGAANAQASLIAAMLDGGSLRIYDGPRPVNPDTEPGVATMLAEVPLASLGPAVLGVVGFRSRSALAVATGRASWARAVGPDGRPLFDATVGSDLRLNITTIVAGATVTIGSATYTVPRT